MENLHPSMKMVYENDARLVELTRAGNRTAFGLLYLRHHAAAWRVANGVTAFSSHAAGIVVEALARVLASPPDIAGDALLRPAVLSGVRQVALEGGTAGDVIAPVAQAPRPGGEIVLAQVEPVAAEALRRLAEADRTALWLTAVENLTPKEVAAIMGLSARRATALAVKGRHDLRAALVRLFASSGHLPCRQAAAYVAGIPGSDHDRPQDLGEHLGRCTTCRMRRAEAADVSAALRGAVAPPPLLGERCQRRWLEQARDYQ